MLTLRTATVTISVPDAAWACAITACDGYLPVPTIRRDVKRRPAMTKAVSFMAKVPVQLPAADEVHDFDPIAIVHPHVGKQRSFDDGVIVLHGDAARIEGQLRQQVGDRK